MPIVLGCPCCGSTLNAPDGMAGRKAKCSTCGEVLVVRAAGADATEPAEPLRPARSRREPPTTPTLAAASGGPPGDHDSEAEETPSGRRLVFLACGAALVVAGIVLAVVLLRGRGGKEEAAIKALSRIKAATEAGVSLSKYCDLLDRLAPEIDRKLDDLPEGEIRASLTEAWDDYKAAAVMWRTSPNMSDVIRRICWGRASGWLARAQAVLAGQEPPPPPHPFQEQMKELYDQPPSTP